MSTLKQTHGLKYDVVKFSTIEAARRFTSRCIKPHVIMLGDSSMYWVAMFVDAQRLQKQGYEIAE